MINRLKSKEVYVLLIALCFFMTFTAIVSAIEGPSTVNITANETKSSNAAYNISTVPGSYIATLNVTATIQNPHWKAFVGWVTGKFTLDDSAGSTIFDWTLANVNGRVYTTRKTASVSWTTVNCSNNTVIETENFVMNHTNSEDNLTATFDDYNNHSEFYVGAIQFLDNYCNYTTNTYVGNSTQQAVFEEVVLYDGSFLIYSTKIEDYATGFDDRGYDFQMIVPEKAYRGNTEITPYYLYIEIV